MKPLALQRVTAGLRRLPLARRLYAALKHYQLCRRPYRGGPEPIRQRLEALDRVIGRDRLPFGTDVRLLAEWLHDLDRVAPGPPANPRRVLFFCAMPWWVQFCLPVAVVLAARDCLVDFVWLPYERMDDTDSPASPARVPRRRLAKLFPFVALHPRLRLINLRHIRRTAPAEELRQLARRYGMMDAQHWLRRELLDFAGDAKAGEFLAFRTARNLDCLVRLRTLVRSRQYDSFLIPNGGIYEFGMAYELGRRSGAGCVTFDFNDRKGVIIASTRDPCVENDLTGPWEADSPHVLTPEREEWVMSFLRRREMPNWHEGDYTWPGQSAAVASEERLRAELRLAPDRPVALLCTNLAYDTTVIGHMRAFPSLAEWMLETIGWFARRPGWQLVVRCHPAEAIHPSGEPATELIRARFPTLPDTIRVIKPADPVNTYGLMPLIKLGLVYTTTTGLEMAARGIPVIVAGKVHYAGKGFTTDPGGRAEYFEALERATAAPGAPGLTPRQVELARCYADIHFRQFPRPFPWYHPGHVETDMANWPLRRILAGDCPGEFLEAFDYLAGRSL